MLCIKPLFFNPLLSIKTKAIFSLGFFVLLANTSYAGSQFRVTPIRVEFSKNNKIALLVVKNEAEQDALIQANLYEWQQEKAEDKLLETKHILVSPPIFRLPAGKQQNIRLGLRSLPAADRELAYRIKISEVPTPEIQQDEEGLNLMLSFSVPIFVKPKGFVTKFASEWRANIVNNNLNISLNNMGNAHEQIKSFKVFAQAQQIAETSSMAYVLPNQMKIWQLKLAKPIDKKNLRIVAESDRGTLEVLVTND